MVSQLQVTNADPPPKWARRVQRARVSTSELSRNFKTKAILKEALHPSNIMLVGPIAVPVNFINPSKVKYAVIFIPFWYCSLSWSRSWRRG